MWKSLLIYAFIIAVLWAAVSEMDSGGGWDMEEGMTMEYRAIYKCRICGQKYTSGTTTGRAIALKTVVELTTMGYSVDAQAPTMTAPHICQGERGVGVADFLGWEKDTPPLIDNWDKEN